MDRLFTYGTLMVPEVIETVIGRPAGPALVAELPDFGCYRVRNRQFPAILAETGQQTRGCLYRGIDSPALERLDHYEGSLYRRHRVRVLLQDGHSIEAWTYVCHPRSRDWLTRETWQLEQFIERHLALFMRGVSRPQT